MALCNGATTMRMRTVRREGSEMYNSNVFLSFHVNLVYSHKYSLDGKQTDFIDPLISRNHR